MWRRVCAPGDVPENGMKEFTLDDKSKVLIVSAGDEYFARVAQSQKEQMEAASRKFGPEAVAVLSRHSTDLFDLQADALRGAGVKGSPHP